MADVVVVGAGVIGLCTAAVLRERGHAVHVLSRDGAAATTSAAAGAIWYPFLAEPRDRVLAWSRTTFHRLRELAADPSSGISMQPVVEGFAAPQPDPWWATAAGAIEHLPKERVPPGYAAAMRLEVPVCDTTRYLPWLVATAAGRGVEFTQRGIESFDEAFAIAPTVVNCTGLGAADLCGDRELQPVRGQVVLVERCALDHALIDDTSPQPFYVIPRGDDVVLGGTAQAGDTRLSPDDGDTRSILDGIAARMPALRGAAVRAVRVGLRPYRPQVRLELERRAHGRRLVHNYGHGGSGYTVAWGCAAEVADLLGR